MNIYAWIGILGIAFFTVLPLLKKSNRIKKEIWKAFGVLFVLLTIVIAVLVFNISYLFAIIVGFLVLVLFDKKTYKKKRLFIYISIIVVIGVISFVTFRENPVYVLKYLQDNPETTSLYVSENGEQLIGYQSTEVRPLASVVKIIIGIEYAMQVDAGEIDKETRVPIGKLDRYYIEGTDGGAHDEWLESMKVNGEINNNQVSLHNVAKGMMTYSSNANTDYLIDLLDVDRINERLHDLDLKQHEDVYPIVGAFLIPSYFKKEQGEKLSDAQLIEKLNDMPMEKYRSLAKDISLQLKAGTIDFEGAITSTLDMQKIWSDRLIGSSASEYGELLAAISRDEFPEVLRELLEWPMELWEEYRESYAHFGAKGGSTMFVFNQAFYVENHNGQKVEIVILMDDLSNLERVRLNSSLNSFMLKMINSKDFREEVKKGL